MPEELYHYGVQGMKWGIRKQAKAVSNSRPVKAYRHLAAKHAHRKAVIEEDKAYEALTQHGQDKHAGKAARLHRKADALEERLAGNSKIANKISYENFKRTFTMTPTIEGRMDRYRSQGYDKTEAMLKSYGRSVVNGASIVAAGAVIGAAVTAAAASNTIRQNRSSKGVLYY